MEFNQAFQDKVLRLLLSAKPEEAKMQLLKMHEEILALYKEKGWTEYPGADMTPSEGVASSASSESAVVERVKRIDKPIAPIKRDSGRPSVIQSVKSASPSPRPSPTASPKLMTLEFATESCVESSRTKQKTSPGSAESDVGIFERFEDKNLEISDDESSPKKKLRRVVLADSSSDNEDDKFKDASSIAIDLDVFPEKAESELVSKVMEKEKKSNHSPSPCWGDSLCSVCKSSSQDEHNSVIQCAECSKNYHQRCHDPEIRSGEKNDPRFIFRCSLCVRKREHRPSSNSSTPQSKPREPSREQTKKRDQEELSSFKRAAEKRRVETGQVSHHSTSGKTVSGSGSLASKAADFLAKHKGLSSNKGAGRSPHGPLSSSVSPGPMSGVKSSPGQGMGLSRWAQQPPTGSAGGLVGLGKLATKSGSGQDFGKAISQSSTLMAQADKKLQAMKKKAAQAKFSNKL